MKSVIYCLILFIISSCSHFGTNHEAADPPAWITYRKLTSGAFYSAELTRPIDMDQVLGEWIVVGYFTLGDAGKIWELYNPEGFASPESEIIHYEAQRDGPAAPFESVRFFRRTGEKQVVAEYSCAFGCKYCGYSTLSNIPRSNPAFESGPAHEAGTGWQDTNDHNRADAKQLISNPNYIIVKTSETEFTLLRSKVSR